MDNSLRCTVFCSRVLESLDWKECVIEASAEIFEHNRSIFVVGRIGNLLHIAHDCGKEQLEAFQRHSLAITQIYYDGDEAAASIIRSITRVMTKGPDLEKPPRQSFIMSSYALDMAMIIEALPVRCVPFCQLCYMITALQDDGDNYIKIVVAFYILCASIVKDTLEVESYFF